MRLPRPTGWGVLCSEQHRRRRQEKKKKKKKVLGYQMDDNIRAARSVLYPYVLVGAPTKTIVLDVQSCAAVSDNCFLEAG